ncbi:hypothetical protein HD884_002147 [Ochrobactrum intermedium]|nr:hypothetical protein [Brucella intermedia]
MLDKTGWAAVFMTDHGVDPSMRIRFGNPHDLGNFQRVLARLP